MHLFDFFRDIFIVFGAFSRFFGCKNFLSGVNFSRLSEKKCLYLTFTETFLVFLMPLVIFLSVKFGFQKSCQCKRNDKYEV